VAEDPPEGQPASRGNKTVSLRKGRLLRRNAEFETMNKEKEDENRTECQSLRFVHFRVLP